MMKQQTFFVPVLSSNKLRYCTVQKKRFALVLQLNMKEGTGATTWAAVHSPLSTHDEVYSCSVRLAHITRG
jgi:hypothetical protein